MSCREQQVPNNSDTFPVVVLGNIISVLCGILIGKSPVGYFISKSPSSPLPSLSPSPPGTPKTKRGLYTIRLLHGRTFVVKVISICFCIMSAMTTRIVALSSSSSSSSRPIASSFLLSGRHHCLSLSSSYFRRSATTFATTTSGSQTKRRFNYATTASGSPFQLAAPRTMSTSTELFCTKNNVAEIVFRNDTRRSDGNSHPISIIHDHTNKKRQQNRMEELEQRILRLNDGKPLNVQSPKQVAIAVFGSPQKATKSVLQKFIDEDISISEKGAAQRELAQCILEYKSLLLSEQKTQRERKSSTNDDAEGVKQASMVNDDTNEISNQRQMPISSHEQSVESLFQGKSLIDQYWKEPLARLSRSTARALVSQLDPTQCPMGYDPNATPGRGIGKSIPSTSAASKKGTFLSYCRAQKELYPQCIVLVRCGDFYETYGIDAIMLVEFAGLNAMAQKAKAGCPYRNIQQTVDALTQHGFSVAVYEEVGNVPHALHAKASSTASGSKLKTRVLSQIVSPVAPTYLYDPNWLLGSSSSSSSSAGGADASSVALEGLPPSRPYVGIAHTAAGYHLVEVSLEEQTVQYSERLTPEAVACRLAAYPPADPIVYIPSTRLEYDAFGTSRRPSLPFLPSVRATSRQRSETINSQYDGGSSQTQKTYENVIVESTLGGFRVRTKILPPHLIPELTAERTDADRYIQTIVDTFLRLNSNNKNNDSSNDHHGEQQNNQQGSTQKQQNDDDTRNDTKLYASPVGIEDFIISRASATTNPLYVETATQLGLLTVSQSHSAVGNAIPPLIHYVLDDAAPAVTRRLVQRYLLIPPPPQVAEAMSTVVHTLLDHNMAVPPLTVPPLGKVLSLLRAQQASANIYGDLLQSMATSCHVLQAQDVPDPDLRRRVVNALLVLCQHESGLPAEKDSFLQRCRAATEVIEAVVSPVFHAATTTMMDDGYDYTIFEDDMVTTHPYIPNAFLERNEATWRGRVQPKIAEDAYRRVQDAAKQLSQAVAEDFLLLERGESATSASASKLIVQDVFNNLIALKQIPPNSQHKSDQYIHPRDRHGKMLKNRYTTTKVQQALSAYVTACDRACQEVASILSNLARRLQDEGHVPALVQASHLNLILSAAFHHSAKANQQGWKLPGIIDPPKSENVCNDSRDQNNHDPSPQQTNDVDHDETDRSSFVGVWPYWMDRSQAVANSFDLNGIFLLTAPNMSGKSTLMRSTAAAALLSVCGFSAPLEHNSKIPRFDTLFLRGASADVPAEDKSAFGAEMGDIAALMRCCGPRSLIFVDELGRGTSPRDGTRLAGAVLEAMAKRGMNGIFATHLHDILDLPLEQRERIHTKRMAIASNDEDGDDFSAYEWTYQLEDGVCTDSLALLTASRFGLPDDIIKRAEELADFLPNKIVDSGDRQAKETTTNQADSSSPKNDAQRSVRRRPNAKDFQRAAEIVEDATGQSSVCIPPRWNPPASLSNQSCVYLLELAEDPPRYYVGETDSLPKRLKQHRQKVGSRWTMSRTLVVPVPSKSQARAWESLLIQKLAQAGFAMESVSDGRSHRRLEYDRES